MSVAFQALLHHRTFAEFSSETTSKGLRNNKLTLIEGRNSVNVSPQPTVLNDGVITCL